MVVEGASAAAVLLIVWVAGRPTHRGGKAESGHGTSVLLATAAKKAGQHKRNKAEGRGWGGSKTLLACCAFDEEDSRYLKCIVF